MSVEIAIHFVLSTEVHLLRNQVSLVHEHSYEGRPTHDGFFIERFENYERIVGRIKGQEYRLEIQCADDTASFNDGVVILTIQFSTGQRLVGKLH